MTIAGARRDMLMYSLLPGDLHSSGGHGDATLGG
jgi:hypothetical protein